LHRAAQSERDASLVTYNSIPYCQDLCRQNLYGTKAQVCTPAHKKREEQTLDLPILL